MNALTLTWEWLTDPASWTGTGGILAQSVAHLRYSFIALLVAALVAMPVGLWVGHTGKGRWLAVNTAGAVRAIPSLGVLFVAVLVLLPRLRGELAFELPALVVLVLLAVPPVLAGTYAGVQATDPAARDAARGMGMTGAQVLRQVEIPGAMPLIMSGLRAAMLQIIGTATIAAIVGLGGLGRFLIDGQASRDYGQMAGGAIVVALLALAVDVGLAAVQRMVVSPGLTRARPGH